MRWYAKEPKPKPRQCECRKRWRFALFPTRIIGQLTVWLESYYAQQFFSLYNDGCWVFSGNRFLKEHK